MKKNAGRRWQIKVRTQESHNKTRKGARNAEEATIKHTNVSPKHTSTNKIKISGSETPTKCIRTADSIKIIQEIKDFRIKDTVQIRTITTEVYQITTVSTETEISRSTTIKMETITAIDLTTTIETIEIGKIQISKIKTEGIKMDTTAKVNDKIHNTDTILSEDND